MSDDGYRGAGGVFVHSFYSQGINEQGNASSELFFEQALAYFGYTGPRLIDPTEQGRTLSRLIREHRGLLVLDGLEPLQHPPSFDQGRLKDPAIRSLLLALAAGQLGDQSCSPSGLCVVDWRRTLSRLKVLRLIDVSDSTSHIDSHPLLRAYFAEQLRLHLPKAWQAGHQLIFEHLCHTTEYRPDTLAGLQPLYQAIIHGCMAGLHQQTLGDVYLDRILRGVGHDGFYSWRRLGASDEAWEIAERGPMPLFQADILLYRARLFRDRAALAEARRLIEKQGYHRRDEELADAEAAAVNWKDKEPSMPTKTFISYSHDNEQHSARVLALANQLRAQGVDAEIDQYETRPPQGWPRWCEEQLRPENSDFVLVVCTETYLKRIEGKVSADEGRGVFWEGDIIYNYIYDQKSKGRFLPVVFDRKDEDFIPIPLRGAQFYLATFDLSDSEYKTLYRVLTYQTIEKPPLGEVVLLERSFNPRRGAEPDTKVLPPVAPRKVRTTFPSSSAAPPALDLLDELKGLPAAWFEELVYRFDKHNAVSAKPAPQSTRAIDLLNIVRATEDGPDRLRGEIQRLKRDIEP